MKQLLAAVLGVVIYVSGTVVLTANITSADTIQSVQFQLDGMPLGAAITTPPYTFSWNTVSPVDAAHVLSVIVTDSAGNQGTSSTNVFVQNRPAVELQIK